MPKRFNGDAGDSGGIEGGYNIVIDNDSIADAANDSAAATGSAAAITFTDPQSAGNVGNSEPGSGDFGKRKRGRPKGSGAGPRPTQTQRDLGVQGVANILMMLHTGLSAVIPEMEMEEKETRTLAEASIYLMAQYRIKQTEKAIAWSGFLGALGMIYGPRVFAIRTRMMMDKKEKKPSNVRPFPTPPGSIQPELMQ